jgi:hypothetical protein
MKNFLQKTLYLFIFFSTPIYSQQQFTAIGTAYTENFNALSTSSNTWADNSTITGWYISCSPTLTAGTGSGTAGACYNFGASGNTDRSIGAVSSGSVTPLFGVRIRNNTGQSLSMIHVTYFGERWRWNTGIDGLVFSYQTGTTVTSLSSGTWTNLSELNFSMAGGTAGALDGNLNSNRQERSATIILSTPLANGEEIFLRWSKTGTNSQGLAVDDLIVRPINNYIQYPLTSNYSATVTGTAIASDAVFGSECTSGSVSATNGMRAQLPNYLIPTNNAYFEYVISAPANNTLYITNIKLENSRDNGGSANWAVFYSVDSTYDNATHTQIGVDGSTTSITWTERIYNPSTPITVNAGSTIRIRIYGGASNGTWFRVRDLKIAAYYISNSTLPIIITGNTDSISFNNAKIINNNVVSDGGETITERGIVYSLNQNPTLSDIKITETGTVGQYNISMMGLLSDTTYYVRAFATNNIGIGYGNEINFKTLVSNPLVIPIFTQIDTVCLGSSFSLPAISDNGVVGTWLPAVDTTQTTTYTFIPNQGQNADSTEMIVVIKEPEIPIFQINDTICFGETITPLPDTSLNGIAGSWFPTIDTTQTTNYLFTPNSNYCASASNIIIVVNYPLLPSFSVNDTLCSRTSLLLPNVSNENITGSWFPIIFDSLSSNTYFFTVDSNQCAQNTSLTINIINNPIISLPADTIICESSFPFILNVDVNDTDISYEWNTSSTDRQIIVFSEGTFSVTITNSNDCISTDEITINSTICTSIKDELETSNISFYPNPATTELHFDSNLEDAHLKIYQINGALQYNMPLSNLNSYSIDISTWPTGVYLIEIENNYQIIRSKFIKH